MRDSFEQFYLTKVALGEGCGCAEHVTRMRDIDAHAARGRPATSFGALRGLAALLARAAASLRSRRDRKAKPVPSSPCP